MNARRPPPMDPLGFSHLGRPQRHVPGRPSHQSHNHMAMPSFPPDSTATGEDLEGDVGSKCNVKQLYGTPNPLCQCCTLWEDDLTGPDDSAKAKRADKERDTYAIVRRRSRHSSKMEWKTHSIDINSPLIKSKLEIVFAEYLSVDITALNLSFNPPFVPFVRKWDFLSKVEENETHATTKEHLKLLVNLLEPEIKESFDILARVETTGFITFPWLSVAFMPGETVLHLADGVPQAAVLREVDLCRLPMGGNYYEFKVDILDTDGKDIGVAEEIWSLFEFKGRRQISNLEVFPLRFHPKREELQRTLTERGKLFESLHGVHLLFYAGEASVSSVSSRPPHPNDMFLPPPPAELGKLRPLKERVIVDAEAFYRLQRSPAPKLRLRTELGREVGFKLSPRDHTHLSTEVRGELGFKISPEELIERPLDNVEADSPDVPTPLTDYECMLASSQVRGFALKTKIWCQFYLTGIQNVIWVEDAFDKLVLEEEEKALMLAITSKPQNEITSTFDDFIPNKGKGIIILLSGPPGVGKTLTAEAVAERTKRSLYRLGAGDLGTTVSGVELHLQDALERCAHWNAVLLIDEVEVFLEGRSSQDLERNELVSTFLRLLEYYEGIMILTTNRISSIDLAFESRIDISLAYKDLDEVGRAQVWREFI